jgi:hypothetical protein
VGSGGVTGSGGKVGTGGTLAVGSGGIQGAPDGGVAAGMGGRAPSPDGGTAADAGSTAAVCTSKMNYSGGNGQMMRPGADCTGCHGNFAIAGTVYPTAHEPDNCIGVNGTTGVKVVITGATGQVLTLTPNSSGNFYSNTKVATPFTVKLTNGANSRMMVSAQTSGGCNGCHTVNGSNAAPGRVMSP